MGADICFDVEGEDVLASPPGRVFHPVYEEGVSVGIFREGIARAKPLHHAWAVASGFL